MHPVTAQAVSANPTPDCSAGSTCTINFTFTGDYYSWTIPRTGTYTLQLWGAAGGSITSLYPTVGGMGGYVSGAYNFTSGQVIHVYPGGKASDQAGNHPYSSCTAVPGGWNGGGGTNTAGNATGGGGASDIRLGGTALSNRIAVAGGGGGSGWTYSRGGAGGGTTGGSGTSSNYAGTGAAGGTQSAGGTAGTSGAGCTRTAGSLGLGGTGSGNSAGGGGGGGGYYGGGGGGFVDGGGGGSSYVALLGSVVNTRGDSSMPNPAGGTMTGNSGNGLVRITYPNAPTPDTFSSNQATPTNSSSNFSFSMTFSAQVTGLSNSDFSNSGTATGCTFSISGSSGTNFTLTVSNCSEGTLIPQLLANSISGIASGLSGPNSNFAATTSIVIDRTAPTISSVSAPANKTYIPTETPTFTVAFSESVTVTGTPRLVLTVGSLTEYADYVSMSDSRTARFRYTVALDANEFDTDGIALSTTLDANGGSIADLASNALTNFGLSAPTLTSVLVAQPPGAPTITSITPASGQLSVAFTAGATRGSAITSYQYSTDNGSTWKTRASGSDGSPVVITTVSASASSLANGTSYNVRLRAVNAAGNGDSSTAVAATPSAITVSGDSTLTTTYGTAASTGTYSATGGTGPYTFTLSSSATGVSISSGVVSVSSTAPAGTYVRNVVATDNASQTGSRQLTITINKASTSISISLPNSATDAALGGAITITATVSQAGSINFRLGGTTISGCGSVSSSAGSATCSWTPGSLGGATLSAVLTPTDSGNYDGATSTNLSITVVNGVTTVSMSLAGGVSQAPKGQNIVITATVDQAGRISFFADGKRISGCFNRAVSGSSATCTWKPAIQKQVNLTSRLVPTNSAYSTATATLQVTVVRRTGTR